jgi:hypothetical protein
MASAGLRGAADTPCAVAVGRDCAFEAMMIEILLGKHDVRRLGGRAI